MRIGLIIALCTCGLQAIAQVKFVKTSNTNYRSIDYNKVIIYLSEDKVPKDAEEIGLVLCEGDNLSKEMIRAKKKASDYGANGLYMVKGDQNDILSSHRKSDKDKDLNINGKRNADYEANMTFVAIRVTEPKIPDTASASHNKALAANFDIDEVVFFDEAGSVMKGTIIGKNDTRAIITRHGIKREVPYSKITKMGK